MEVRVIQLVDYLPPVQRWDLVEGSRGQIDKGLEGGREGGRKERVD